MYVCSCLFGSFLFVANGISKGCGRSVRYLITSTTCNYMYGVTYLHHLRIVINVTNEPRTHGGYMYSLLAERVCGTINICSKYIFSARLTVTYVHVSYIRIQFRSVDAKERKKKNYQRIHSFFFFLASTSQPGFTLASYFMCG